MVKSFLLATTILRSERASLPRTFCRYKSLTAAIERGRAHGSRDARVGREQSQRDPFSDAFQDPFADTFPTSKGGRKSATKLNTSRRSHAKVDRTARTLGRNAQRSPSARQTVTTPSHTNTASGTQRQKGPTTGPKKLPFSTAASEFLFGHSSVLAALKARRRKFYKLYIHNVRGHNHEGSRTIVLYARKLEVPIQEVGDEYLRAFDRASDGRPHNGFVLETSPLPIPPITELGRSSIDSETFELSLDSQSAEDMNINGRDTIYRYNSAGWRHPLILYIDGVEEQGNMGATARSAYFLGVDAIVTAARGSAPWSSITVKASAGAAEAIPIFSVAQPTDFLSRSARAGWRIYASDTVPPVDQPPHSTSPLSAVRPTDFASNIIYTYAKRPRRLPADHCPVEAHPTILMMGNEATGLRSSLLNVAHFKVGIRHGRSVDEVGVDSLNVSVAASLLCYEMLRKPKPRRKVGELLF